MTSLKTTLTDRILGERQEGCGCEPTFEGDVLCVDASACADGGALQSSPDCRETVVGALTERDVDRIVVREGGIESRYEDAAAALLVAAGRFVEAVRGRDARLARRARRDPLAATREATGRADAVSDAAAEVGLAELAAGTAGYEFALAPVVGLQASDWQVETAVPPGARLTDTRELDTGATVRRYCREESRDLYVLDPPEHGLETALTETLAAAYAELAEGSVSGRDRAPGRAVRAVAPDDAPIERLSRILHKHTRGYGLLRDLFADPEVSDVYVTAPVADNPVRVTVDDETIPTNVRVTAAGVEALASRFRRESGRGFSRADPVLDASVTIGDRRVRVAGVTEPASTGTAFAFRAHDRDVWTLPALVANGTLTAETAALLSLAVERGHSLLVAGPRGAGKTTLVGALLWELPPAVRTVVIEDTPELPVASLQDAGRDVQALRTSDDGTDFDPTVALRSALRLGDGALVLGEVRGEEAQTLYEAMRVGANSEAVLGTIHGDGARATYERVVSDLGVPPSSFCVTDLVVTVERATGSRQVSAVEEVIGSEEPTFEPLYRRPEGHLRETGRLERGNSRLILSMTEPGETYADIRELQDRRRSRLADLVATGRTGPEAVTAAGRKRETGS